MPGGPCGPDWSRVCLCAGAAGGPGVARALAILRADIISHLKLLGVAGLSELGRGLLQRVDGTSRGLGVNLWRPPHGRPARAEKKSSPASVPS